MLTLPSEILTLLAAFAPLFAPSVFQHAQLLLVGAILTPGARTVTAALRAVGLSHCRQFQNYHRVLNRADWSLRQGASLLLRLLVKVFVPDGPLVIGGDDTIERRRGDKIKAKGIYRDPVRSSHSHFVKTSGLRWLCLMLLAPIPWAGRIWALPFLTLLAASERSQQEQHPQGGRLHSKKLTDWMRQAVLQVRRWFPEREIVLVADASYAALELLAALQHASITVVTRLRLDAALYDPAPLLLPGQKRKGRPPRKGARQPSLQQRLNDPATLWTLVTMPQWYGYTQRAKTKSQTTKSKTSKSKTHWEKRVVEIASGTAVWYHAAQPTVPLRWVLVRDPQGEFAPQAFLCTEARVEPTQILTWFVARWQMEVTFREMREHLGMETQRQWNDLAIARTTPLLLGLFSLVTLLAHRLVEQQVPAVRLWGVRQSAWYVKEQATFSDALAWVRRHLWSHAQLPFSTSQFKPDRKKLQHALLERMTDLLCYPT